MGDRPSKLGGLWTFREGSAWQIVPVLIHNAYTPSLCHYLTIHCIHLKNMISCFSNNWITGFRFQLTNRRNNDNPLVAHEIGLKGVYDGLTTTDDNKLQRRTWRIGSHHQSNAETSVNALLATVMLRSQFQWNDQQTWESENIRISLHSYHYWNTRSGRMIKS